MATANLVFRNALLIDGTGTPGRVSDVAIKNDRISAIGPALDIDSAEEIDAQNLVLAPGFIDAHTHDDRIVLLDPAMECKISQGVTTVVTGNCGISIAPVTISQRPPSPIDLIGEDPAAFYSSFADYFDVLKASPPAVNVVAQVGHSSLRLMAMSEMDRPASASEITIMCRALEQALEDGAAGLSTGLEYSTANAAPTDEVIALAEVTARFNGFHSTHMRNEGDGVMASIEETLHIGNSAKIPVIISHHKCAGVSNHGQSNNTLPFIEQASKTQPVALDCYPYVASSTELNATRVARASKTIVAWSRSYPEHAGKELNVIAKELLLNTEDTINALLPAGAIYFNMDEDDVRRILSFPKTMIGSDGLPHDEFPHPRLWGTFPRVLGHYAREVGLFSIEEAVKKMTSLTAAAFGIKDRGVIAEGNYADLVLFNASTIIDSATFDNPTIPAAGIEQVYVNGERVWQNLTATGTRPGRGLKRQSLSPLQFCS